MCGDHGLYPNNNSSHPANLSRTIDDSDTLQWENGNSGEWSVDDPSLEELQHALARLDNSTYTIVTIHQGEIEHMAIGGGDGRFLVYATQDNETFWTLQRETAGEGPVSLAVGGQDAEYPASQVVDARQALQAAIVYLQTSHLDDSQGWIED